MERVTGVLRVVVIVVSVTLLLSAAAARDTEWFKESNDCISYHKTTRYYWWTDKTPYEVTLTACGYEKREILEQAGLPEGLARWD